MNIGSIKVVDENEAYNLTPFIRTDKFEAILLKNKYTGFALCVYGKPIVPCLWLQFGIYSVLLRYRRKG